MPEGHTIHRLAKDLAADLRPGAVTATSPQGRFDAGAARIDGARLTTSEAWGKHLFCRWDSGDVLHVHLGLIGKFRPVPVEEDVRDSVRLRLEGGDTAWHLTGPQTCAVIAPDDVDELVAPLGPDPLRRGSTRKPQFVQRLRRTRRAVGAALLDQSIVAGIGNVYRAELLLLMGIHPERPANQIDEDQAAELWDLTVAQLKRGVAWNRIVTVDEADVGRRVTRRIKGTDALYAYKRTDEPCRRCHTLIEDRKVAGRSIWFCPTCQPG